MLGAFVVAYFVSLLPLHSHFPRYVLPLIPALGALAGRFRALAPVTLLLLIVPLTWSIRDDARLTRTDTRVVAARWIDGARAEGLDDRRRVFDRGARAATRSCRFRCRFPGHDARVDVGGAGWILVSGAVADRVLAARDEYPQRAAFYARLPQPAFRLRAHDGTSGPWVAVYRR